MSIYRRLVRGLFAALVGILMAVGVAASASAATSPANGKDPRIAAALARIGNGTYTQADLSFIRRFPEIAKQVPDPAKAPEEVFQATATPSADGEVSILAAGWWNVDRYWTKTSLTGSIIYRWHHALSFYTNGSAVTSFGARYDYLSEAQSIVYVRGLTVNQSSGLGGYTAWSHLQRHLEYCVVKYGCYANTYPRAKITVYANGTYSASGSAG